MLLGAIDRHDGIEAEQTESVKLGSAFRTRGGSETIVSNRPLSTQSGPKPLGALAAPPRLRPGARFDHCEPFLHRAAALHSPDAGHRAPRFASLCDGPASGH